MLLALDSKGRIGRKVRDGEGLSNVVDVARPASERGEVGVSYSKIEQDNIKAKQEYAYNRAKEFAQAQKARAKRMAEKIQYEQGAQKAARMQQMGDTARQVTNRLYANHFIQQQRMPETARVAKSMKADFTANEILFGPKNLRPISPIADFRQFDIVGNPLTRDGQFGPVTDYDRFVQGTELDNARVVGGTMMGRLNGCDIPFKPRRHHYEQLGCNACSAGMGDWYDPTSWFDSSSAEEVSSDTTSSESPGWWNGITDFISNTGEAAADQFQESAPQIIAQAGLNSLKQSLGIPISSATQQGNTIVVKQPAQAPATTYITVAGTKVPKMALAIGAAGLLGIVAIKLLRKA